MLFGDLTRDLVRQGLAEWREQSLRERDARYDELEDWYRGGTYVTKYLEKKPGETVMELSARQKLIEYPNYVKCIADELVRNVYGFDVTRKLLDPATDAHNETLQAIFEANRIVSAQRMYGQGMVLLGDGWARAWWDEERQIPSVFPVHPKNVWFEADPNNPYKITTLIEKIVDDSSDPKDDQSTYWVWTNDEFAYVDSSGAMLPAVEGGDIGPWPNLYGLIPYSHWVGRPLLGENYGLSCVNDAVTIQKVILNRLSDLNELVENQAHGLLITVNNENPELSSGPRRFIGLGPGGEAYYINPNADIPGVLATMDASVSRMFESASIPISILRGGSASSGLQLAIEMRPLTAQIEELRTTSKQSERDLIRAVCAVGAAHGLALPTAEACNPEVDFGGAMLPSDKDSEFKRDFAMVTAIPPLMTRESFVRKWQTSISDDAGLAEYMQKLEAEGGSMISASGSGALTSPAGAPAQSGDYGPVGGRSKGDRGGLVMPAL
jgi:hypothetical protein